MRRVVVIGCPGSGKSTFSRELNKITKLPLYHLDMMYWNSDKTKVEKAVFQEKLSEILQKDKWIIDGNYNSTMEARFQACDTIVFLDYPVDICLDGIRERQGKERNDIPWVETEENKEFTEFVKNYNTNSRPLVLELLKKYSQKNIIVFRNRDEANKFLARSKMQEYRRKHDAER